MSAEDWEVIHWIMVKTVKFSRIWIVTPERCRQRNGGPRLKLCTFDTAPCDLYWKTMMLYTSVMCGGGKWAVKSVVRWHFPSQCMARWLASSRFWSMALDNAISNKLFLSTGHAFGRDLVEEIRALCLGTLSFLQPQIFKFREHSGSLKTEAGCMPQAALRVHGTYKVF